MHPTDLIHQEPSSVLDRVFSKGVYGKLETLLLLAILIIALLTRFTELGSRSMSHDESLHAYYAWRIDQDLGYEHTPLMHGPFQFHLIALSFFIFGDSDFSARIPAAIAGIAALGVLLYYRRWLGRWGALFAVVMLAISPTMLFYSRYARNDAIVVLLALTSFLAIFRYLEDRDKRWLLLLAGSLSLHFATKETAFIYVGQIFLIVGGYLLWNLWRQSWKHSKRKMFFSIGILALILGAIAFGLGACGALNPDSLAAGDVNLPLEPSSLVAFEAGGASSALIGLGFIMASMGLLLVAAAAMREFGRRLRRDFPALDIVLVTGTLTLPMLSALPAILMGWDPLSYADPATSQQWLPLVGILFMLSAGIGLVWNRRTWPRSAAVFWLPFVLLFTNFFEHPAGFTSGLVGSLGYWLAQHGVGRGNQPWFYYGLIQIPFYEFLPMIGSLIALRLGIRRVGGWQELHRKRNAGFPIILGIGIWAFSGLVIYSLAGERMPWLTVHIVLPMILLAGWAFGRLFQDMRWPEFFQENGHLALALACVSTLGGAIALGRLLGDQPPFVGTQLVELHATMTFLAGWSLFVFGLFGIWRWASRWWGFRLRAVALMLFIFLCTALTLRTALRAAFRYEDEAAEFLVYAHSSDHVKQFVEQVERFSQRYSRDYAAMVAFNKDVSWPFTWYLRNYPQRYYFGETVTEQLVDYPIIIAGESSFQSLDALLGRDYYMVEAVRMLWPTQGYMNMTLADLIKWFGSADSRRALWDVWFNRDYRSYGEITGLDVSTEGWDPSRRMRLYLQKDVGFTLWDQGTMAAALPGTSISDPYEEQMIQWEADITFGGQGSDPGAFLSPHGLTVGSDGSLYVADTGNDRIQRLDADGQVLAVWGEASEENQQPAPGTFREPWDVAVSPDGDVYVADTWNHRVQRFSNMGEFKLAFGPYTVGAEEHYLWGPRGIAVDSKGRVFVTDTGNKKIVVYDGDGNWLTEFGAIEGDLGLNEPVGIDVDAGGKVYVVDTWNQRIMVYQEDSQGDFRSIRSISVAAWHGQSSVNKPYLASENGQICVTDPEGFRILCFSEDGAFIKGWGDYGLGAGQFDTPSGVAFDGEGGLWVVDSANGRVMRFSVGIPEELDGME